jgi:hypothetical protein
MRSPGSSRSVFLSRVVLCATLLTLVPSIGVRAEAPADSDPTPPTTAATESSGHGFALDLEHLDPAVVGRFRLFPELAERSPGGAGRSLELSPTLVIGPTSGIDGALIFTVDGRPVPEGLQTSFRPLTWADMDPWQKTGQVVATASAVAGAAYLLKSIFD